MTTIHIGVYKDQTGAAGLVFLDDEIQFGVTGPSGWPVLAHAMVHSPRAERLSIYTVREGLYNIIKSKAPPRPDKSEVIKLQYGKDQVDAAYGGCPHHWKVLQELSPYGSRWAVNLVEESSISEVIKLHANSNDDKTRTIRISKDEICAFERVQRGLLDFSLEEMGDMPYG